MILRKVIKIAQSYALVVNNKVFHGKTSNFYVEVKKRFE